MSTNNTEQYHTNNPSSPRYWKNIIPAHYTILDRTGVEYSNLVIAHDTDDDFNIYSYVISGLHYGERNQISPDGLPCVRYDHDNNNAEFRIDVGWKNWESDKNYTFSFYARTGDGQTITFTNQNVTDKKRGER